MTLAHGLGALVVGVGLSLSPLSLEAVAAEKSSTQTEQVSSQLEQDRATLFKFYTAYLHEKRKVDATPGERTPITTGPKMRVLTDSAYQASLQLRKVMKELYVARDRYFTQMGKDIKVLEKEYLDHLELLRTKASQMTLEEFRSHIEATGNLNYPGQINQLYSKAFEYDSKIRKESLKPLNDKIDALPFLATLQLRHESIFIDDYPKGMTEAQIARQLVDVLSQRYPGQYGFPTK